MNETVKCDQQQNGLTVIYSKTFLQCNIFHTNRQNLVHYLFCFYFIKESQFSSCGHVWDT